MALLKEIEYKGLVCTYHKIFKIESIFAKDALNSEEYSTINASVASYLNQAQRETDATHWLRLRTYHFDFSDPNAPANEKIDKVYKALKKLSDFKGADDV